MLLVKPFRLTVGYWSRGIKHAMIILLPDNQGNLLDYTLIGNPLGHVPLKKPPPRQLLAAAHVVANPYSELNPSVNPSLDWDATLTFRRHLAGLGLGIAEAMDTAQRGSGLAWPTALELIKQTLTEIPKATVFSGAGTDHLTHNETINVDQVIKAYLIQVEAIQKLNGRIIVMASRALARVAKNSDDYIRVYKTVLDHCEKPVIIHWLGEMFDPQLEGYWGASDWSRAQATCLAIIEENASKIEGIKLSLLDKNKEIEMRRRLPATVRMFTGDDFNYPELILGDDHGHSDALLGIFDPIAPACTQALNALSENNLKAYNSLFMPTVPLARHIFQSPTQYYKTGVVFLAWLNGFQEHFIMINGSHAMRSLPYFVDCFKLADQAGLLSRPDLAVSRMKSFLKLYGVG